MAEASVLTEKENNSAYCAACEKRTVTNSFCIECLEHLCGACIYYHRRNKASRDHRILTGDELPDNVAVFQEIISMTQCTTHQHQTLAFFCDEHKCHLCAHCVAEDHRKCSIRCIEDTAEETGVNRIIRQSGDLLSKLKLSKQELVSTVTNLKHKEKSLHDQREALFEKEVGKLKTWNNKVRQDIEGRFKGIIECHQHEVDKHKDKEEKVAHVNEVAVVAEKYFDQDKVWQTLIAEKLSATLEEKCLLLKDPGITSRNNVDLLSLNLSDTAFNKIHGPEGTTNLSGTYKESLVSIQTETSSEEIDENEIIPTQGPAINENNDTSRSDKKDTEAGGKTYKVEKSIKLSSDKEKCKAIKCMLTPNNSYIVVDSNNRKLKLFDEEFKLIHSRGLENIPVGACTVDANKLILVYASKTNVDAVVLEPRSIQDVSCVFRVEGPALSVASIGSQKLGIMVNYGFLTQDKSVSIEVRYIKGDLLLNIPIVRNGSRVSALGISNPLVLTSVNDDFLVGSFWKLSRLDERGKLTWFCKGDFFRPLQQVTDAVMSGGFVYVCGNQSRNIHRVSEVDHKDRRVVLRDLNAPRCLCVNPEKKQIIIGFDDNDNFEIHPI